MRFLLSIQRMEEETSPEGGVRTAAKARPYDPFTTTFRIVDGDCGCGFYWMDLFVFGEQGALAGTVTIICGGPLF
jgi:hypothetical protein